MSATAMSATNSDASAAIMDDDNETVAQLAVAQEVVFATVAAGQGGTNYHLNDTVTLANGVVLKATTMTGTAIASVTIVNPGSTSTTPPANPVSQVSTSGTGTGAKFNLTWAPISSVDIFPAFTPIIPTSVFPPGGGVGSIGEAVLTPTFPPPTPPPIGAVPVGPLVGPAIAPAAVPPSTAGFPLLRYQPPGSATVPAVNGYFPKFTTTTAYAGFPNNPPTGVPIIFSNIDNRATKTGAVWDNKTPPSTPTVAQITLNGASNLTPLNVDDLRLGHEEFAERHDGAVLPGEDASHLHQSLATKNSRRKRMSETGSSGRSNHTK